MGKIYVQKDEPCPYMDFCEKLIDYDYHVTVCNDSEIWENCELYWQFKRAEDRACAI